MRRTVAVIIATVLLITLAAFSVNAATATATMDKVTVSAGQTVTLTVSVKDTEPLVSAAIEIKNLPKGFTIKDGKWRGNTLIASFANPLGICAYKDAVKAPFDIFTLTLQTDKNTASGNYKIEFEFQYSNEDGDKIQVEENFGNVTILGKTENPDEGEENPDEGEENPDEGEEIPEDEKNDDVEGEDADNTKEETDKKSEEETEKKPFDWKLTLLIVAGVLVVAGLVITITTTAKKEKK